MKFSNLEVNFLLKNLKEMDKLKQKLKNHNNLMHFSEEEREVLYEETWNIFQEIGIDANDLPNENGLMAEKIIDKLTDFDNRCHGA